MRRTPKIISLIAGILNLLIGALAALAVVLLAVNMAKYPGGRKDLLADLWDYQGSVIVHLSGLLLVGIQLIRRRKNGYMALGFLLQAVSFLMEVATGLRFMEAGERFVLSAVIQIAFYLVLASDCLWPLGDPIFETDGYRWLKCGLLVGPMALWRVIGYIRGGLTFTALIVMVGELSILLGVAAMALGKETILRPSRPIVARQPVVVQPPKERPQELPHYVLPGEGRKLGANMAYTYRFSEYDADMCRKCADALLSQSGAVKGILMIMSNGMGRNYAPEYAADRRLLVAHPDMLPRFRELQIETEDNGLYLKVKLVPGTDRIEVTAPPELPQSDITLRLDAAVHMVLRQDGQEGA